MHGRTRTAEEAVSPHTAALVDAHVAALAGGGRDVAADAVRCLARARAYLRRCPQFRFSRQRVVCGTAGIEPTAATRQVVGTCLHVGWAQAGQRAVPLRHRAAPRCNR